MNKSMFHPKKLRPLFSGLFVGCVLGLSGGCLLGVMNGHIDLWRVRVRNESTELLQVSYTGAEEKLVCDPKSEILLPTLSCGANGLLVVASRASKRPLTPKAILVQQRSFFREAQVTYVYQ